MHHPKRRVSVFVDHFQYPATFAVVVDIDAIRSPIPRHGLREW